MKTYSTNGQMTSQCV